MKTSTYIHLHRLVRLHGSYSQTARALGMDVRNLRRNRHGDMKPPTRRTLVMAGKLLMLRQLLRELVRSGALTPAQLRAAWAAIPPLPDTAPDRTC